MIEFVLLVWLVVGEPGAVTVAPAIEVGTYHQEARCTAAAATVRFERPDVSFIALCVARDK